MNYCLRCINIIHKNLIVNSVSLVFVDQMIDANKASLGRPLTTFKVTGYLSFAHDVLKLDRNKLVMIFFLELPYLITARRRDNSVGRARDSSSGSRGFDVTG